MAADVVYVLVKARIETMHANRLKTGSPGRNLNCKFFYHKCANQRTSPWVAMSAEEEAHDEPPIVEGCPKSAMAEEST